MTGKRADPASQWQIYWLPYLADELPWLGSGYRRCEARLVYRGRGKRSKPVHWRARVPGSLQSHTIRLDKWHQLKPALSADIAESGLGVGTYFAAQDGRATSPQPYREPRIRKKPEHLSPALAAALAEAQAMEVAHSPSSNHHTRRDSRRDSARPRKLSGTRNSNLNGNAKPLKGKKK